MRNKAERIKYIKVALNNYDGIGVAKEKKRSLSFFLRASAVICRTK